MLYPFVAFFVGGYAIATSLVLTYGGRQRLWLMSGASLALIVLAAFILGRQHGVPNVERMVLYLMALLGPIVIIPTLLLSFPNKIEMPWATRLLTALVGALIGAFCGWALLVFALGAS
jgi:hypothetical protein